MDNQRVFFDNLAKTLGITADKDWLSVTRQQVIQHGGSWVLFKYKTLSKGRSYKLVRSDIL
jgi:hypothetical protein